MLPIKQVKTLKTTMFSIDISMIFIEYFKELILIELVTVANKTLTITSTI